MDVSGIIERVQSSFCNLTKFKIRQNCLEVITAYSTINNKFVSVFVTYTRGKLVVTDSGWIDQNYYDAPQFEESDGLLNRILDSFQYTYNVKYTLDKDGVKYYYKNCENIEQIPSSVFDLANFIVGILNARFIQLKDEKEERERETFRMDANNFLKSNYTDSVKLRKGLDDFKNIRFNAIVSRDSKIYLITYVTGSTQYYFENDLRKSIVNFEIANKSKFKSHIKERLAILNDKSDGYLPQASASFFDLLRERTSKEPLRWTEKEKLLQYI